MKTIQLTQGYETVVDDSDFDWLNQYSWCVWIPAGKPYAASAMAKGRKLFKMHRILLRVDDPCISVDHKDGNGLNNQRDNIRVASSRQNNQNTVKESISGYRGVSQAPSRRWQASIRVEGRQVYLGTFDDPVEAAKAYDIIAVKEHGEFAVLNFT